MWPYSNHVLSHKWETNGEVEKRRLWSVILLSEAWLHWWRGRGADGSLTRCPGMPWRCTGTGTSLNCGNSAKDKKKKQDEELPLRRLRNLKGHPKSLRHYAVKGHVKLKHRQAKEVWWEKLPLLPAFGTYMITNNPKHIRLSVILKLAMKKQPNYEKCTHWIWALNTRLT